jgi:hypothetical protein
LSATQDGTELVAAELAGNLVAAGVAPDAERVSIHGSDCVRSVLLMQKLGRGPGAWLNNAVFSFFLLSMANWVTGLI